MQYNNLVSAASNCGHKILKCIKGIYLPRLPFTELFNGVIVTFQTAQ